MTAANREACILETLKWEGGYSNDAGDPGGPTNWGITIADARRYWRPSATAADVRAMPRSVAVEIYRNKYWKTPYYDCDHLAAGVDLAVFDYGVNSGPARARKALMASIGGPSAETIRRICAYRMTFLHNLSIWRLFGRGWTRRVVGIQSVALRMAAAHPLPPEPAPQPQPKEPPVATPTITLPAGISIDTIWQILKSLLGSLPATKPAVPVIDDIFKIIADVQGGKPLGTDAGWLLVDAGNAILHANGVDPTQPRT